MTSLTKIYEKQIDFSKKTFGPGMRTKGLNNHIKKELDEIAKDPVDLEEWIDVMTLAFDGAWRCAAYAYPRSDSEALVKMIVSMYKMKQKKNHNRKWPDWRTMSEDDAIEHDRTKD